MYTSCKRFVWYLFWIFLFVFFLLLLLSFFLFFFYLEFLTCRKFAETIMRTVNVSLKSEWHHIQARCQSPFVNIHSKKEKLRFFDWQTFFVFVFHWYYCWVEQRSLQCFGGSQSTIYCTVHIAVNHHSNFTYLHIIISMNSITNSQTNDNFNLQHIQWNSIEIYKSTTCLTISRLCIVHHLIFISLRRTFSILARIYGHIFVQQLQKQAYLNIIYFEDSMKFVKNRLWTLDISTEVLRLWKTMQRIKNVNK